MKLRTLPIGYLFALFCAATITFPGSCALLGDEEPEVGSISPKVITNTKPSRTPDKDAEKIHDATPQTKESVQASPLPKYVARPAAGDTVSSSDTRIERRKTLALALGGGGVRGTAHIGVLRVLEREGIPIDYIVGNSMGAMVGGLYCAGVSANEMEHTALHGDFKKSYAPLAIPRALVMPLTRLLPAWTQRSYAGLITGKKFEKKLDSMIPRGKNDFKNLRIPFSAVATNLLDGKAYRINEGKVSTAIRASASISPILKPVEIGDKLFIDGAVRANLPASSAREIGADVVLAVLVDEPLKSMEKQSFRSYNNVANRLTDIVLAVTDEHQLQFANIIINPDVGGISKTKDNAETIAKIIKAGEIAAIKALPEIRRQLNLPESARLVDTSTPLQ